MKVVFCLLALAAAASAVETTHNGHKAAIIQRVQASQFGATVLADLQERLQAGDPISALRTFIAKIRDRIVTEGKTDTADQDAAEKLCLEELVEVDGKIKTSVEGMAYELGVISTQHARARQAEIDIAAKELQISKTEAAIKMNEDAIVAGDALREENEELFAQATQDAANVKDAVNEILRIESESSLYTNQEETANMADKSVSIDSVAGVSAASLIQLQAVSAKVKDETAKSFIQLAALSAQLFGQNKGDIDELRALLNKLVQEIDSYVQMLEEENIQSRKDWADLKATMQTEIADWQADLVQYRADLKVLQATLADALQKKAAAVVSYKNLLGELRAQYESKQRILKKCSDGKDSYLTKMKSRQEELETLDLIYEIIKDKLQDAQDNIASNVTQLMTGGYAAVKQKCHCDHACGVFDDCCPSCDVASLPDVVSSIPEPEYEGGEKERPDRDARAVYGTYMDDRKEGFHF